MLNIIQDFLLNKGYAQLDEKMQGLYYRETEDVVYAVTLSYASPDGEDDLQEYTLIQQRVEFLLTTRLAKRAETLHLIVMKNQEVGAYEQHLLDHLTNVWFVARNTGKIFIYEKQIVRFDDLHDNLESYIVNSLQRRKKETSFRFTPVNIIIVVLNILAYIAISVIHGDFFAVYDARVMLAMGALNYDTFMDGAWYQIVTSLFLHYGYNHLFGNMILLTYIGCELERRVGSFAYIVVYFLSGIFGNVISLMYYNFQGINVVSAGASGAVHGVMGALLVLLIVKKDRLFRLSPSYFVAGIVVSILYGLMTESVDNSAHIGGLVMGIIVGFLLSKISRYGKLEEVKFTR